jgi:hypothetical protein
VKANDAEFEKYAAENRRQHGPTCSVCKLSKAERDQIRRWCDSQPITLVSRFLQAKGMPIRSNTLGRHYREGHEQR